MKDFDFLIRFGVHKDRETLRSLRETISGIIVPAHILCHSTDATIAAISYIKKDYYIDPMTFLYASSIEYYLGDNKKKFKPSIEKLTKDYGLLELFEEKGFKALEASDFTEEVISSFSEKSLNLQCKKVDEKKQGAYNKYTELLKQVGENHIVDEMNSVHEPKAVIPPYFLMDSVGSDWLAINLAFAEKTKTLTDKKVVPIVCVTIDCLDDSLLKSYENFKELFLWVSNFDERTASLEQIKIFFDFIVSANEKGFVIRNMYGTYFSILLGKVGLAGVSCGIFYGESKGAKAKVGGVPQSRYYIRAFHQFFSLPEAIAMIKKYPELLDKDCSEAMEIINSNPDNIFSLEKDHSKAQAHFIHCRKKEISVTGDKSIPEIAKELEETFLKFKPEFDSAAMTTKTIDHLDKWAKIINPPSVD